MLFDKYKFVNPEARLVLSDAFLSFITSTKGFLKTWFIHFFQENVQNT